ncbi:uncharacterized protein LOC114540209 [Dendronephthya gigantea]|uniref:uncharacterized protein LOC114531047 n=1 Tax=Dendronephthya gigantea TaxID=151771 RepID=UPI00106B9988|nr:uncharacterized protein LOC114531047 [Dendronephthya gigantea]XP_028416280.1 uncharacterized protein LOC114540209 [Dendronephthya gigantea]
MPLRWNITPLYYTMTVPLHAHKMRKQDVFGHFVFTTELYPRYQKIEMATSNPITKIGRQHEKTWSRLQKRLSDCTFDYSRIMPDNIITFLIHKATSVNSCLGYLLPTILATVSYLLSRAKVTVSTVNRDQSTSLYTIFVGYPGTGKSPAIEHGCIKPLQSVLRDDVKNGLLDRTTSSGLIKHLSVHGTGFIVSPEVSDVLNKLLKSDEETCSGDAMVLCKLFSGERISFHYATENTREIDANTPFSILGSTQMPNAAKLIAKMDKGQGLLDRFLISVPSARCPKSKEIEQSLQYLSTECIDDFDNIYRLITQFHTDNVVKYTFDDEAEDAMRNERDAFISDINDAIADGETTPPKSKKLDLLPRMAATLHVLQHAMECALAAQEDMSTIPTTIPKETFEKAKLYVDHVENQKHMLCEFIKSITNDTCDEERPQPNAGNIKSGILIFPGPVVTYRAFVQSGPRLTRGISNEEFVNATEQLKEDYGHTINVRVARSSKTASLFVKKAPNQFEEWPSEILCKREEYENSYHRPCHKAISPSIRRLLRQQNILTEEQLNM